MNKPWLNEPDFDKGTYKGYEWYMKRNGAGAWCGYVGVPKGHRYFGLSYDDIPIIVHGGLTFSEGIRQRTTGTEYTLIGFDCAHADDLIPGKKKPDALMQLIAKILPELSEPNLLTQLVESHESHQTYKDIAFVKNEIYSMIDQLIEAA